MSSGIRRGKRTSREAGKSVVQVTGDGDRPVSSPANSSGVRRTRPEFVPVGIEPERIRGTAGSAEGLTQVRPGSRRPRAGLRGFCSGLLRRSTSREHMQGVALSVYFLPFGQCD